MSRFSNPNYLENFPTFDRTKLNTQLTMSEPRQLRPRKAKPVVLLPPVGKGRASPKVCSYYFSPLCHVVENF